MVVGIKRLCQQDSRSFLRDWIIPT